MPLVVVVAAAALAPFVVGRVVGTRIIGGGGFVLCPFRAATGLPCPLCGATRSVVLASHGDAGFLLYNPVWAAVLLVVAVIALAVAWARATGHPGVERVLLAPARPAALAPLGAVAWAVALLHRTAITSH